MKGNTSFPDLLRTQLRSRQRTNAHYSLRAFARTLGLSPSYLSKLIAGKRAASEQTFLKITSRLKLNEEEINSIAEYRTFKIVDPQFEFIREDHFRLIADWHHYAILECATLADFNPHPEWIAKRLSISVERVKSALDRLARLNLLQIDEHGKVTKVVKDYSSVKLDGLSSANTEHERQILEGAINALEETSSEHRHQGSLTIAIPSSRVDEAKDKIRKFRRELMSTLQRRGKRDAVYQFSISFYPLTKTKIKNGVIMKNTVLSLIFGFALIQSAAAFAGGENEGPAYCSFAKYICQNPSKTLLACAFSNLTYVSITTPSGYMPYRFLSSEILPQEGVRGGGVTFIGHDTNLKIQTDAYPSELGWPSEIAIPSLKINESLRCRMVKR